MFLCKVAFVRVRFVYTVRYGTVPYGNGTCEIRYGTDGDSDGTVLAIRLTFYGTQSYPSFEWYATVPKL